MMDVELLQKAISKNADRLSARDVAKDHERRLLEQKRRSYDRSLIKEQHAKSRQRTYETQRDISRDF